MVGDHGLISDSNIEGLIRLDYDLSRAFANTLLLKCTLAILNLTFPKVSRLVIHPFFF